MPNRVAVGVATLVAIAALTAPVPASGHGGGPRIAVEPERSPAGSEVLVSGDSFGIDDEVTIEFVGEGSSLTLAMATPDDEGHFHVGIRVPDGALDGLFAVRASTPAGGSVAATLVVSGQAGGGEGGDRDPDERAPANARGTPGAPPATVPQIYRPLAPLPVKAPPPPPSSGVDPALLAIVTLPLLLIGGLVSLVVTDRRGRRRSTRPGQS